MKLLHRKFLTNEPHDKEKTNILFTNGTSRSNYFLNQFLIWIVIIFIAFFILKFLDIVFI